MFNLFKKSTVKVKLIEALDNDLIGEVKLSFSQLPASFKEAITVHLINQDWEVVKAEADYKLPD